MSDIVIDREKARAYCDRAKWFFKGLVEGIPDDVWGAAFLLLEPYLKSIPELHYDKMRSPGKCFKYAQHWVKKILTGNPWFPETPPLPQKLESTDEW